MSLSYAESLSYFPHKGKVGMPELSEKSDDLKSKLIANLSMCHSWIEWKSFL